MNYPYKYIVIVYDDIEDSESCSTFYYTYFSDAEYDYIYYKESGSRVLMFRILKSDNFNFDF